MIFNAGGTIPNEAVLLWTNENPKVAFPEQTINIDTNKYSMFFIVTAYEVSSNYSSVNIIVNTKDDFIAELKQLTSVLYNNDRVYRYLTITETGIVCSSGYNGADSTNERYAIPLYIYGSFAVV